MAISEKGKGVFTWFVTVFVGIATLLLIVIGISFIMRYQYIGANSVQNATIAVSGTGEAFAVPNTAEFSFTVKEEENTVPEAQREATKKANAVISYLKDAGIEEKDIKTTSYNINPRYEYYKGNRTLEGYDVTEVVSVKVEKTEDAGKILSKVGSLGVSSVSGLEFTVADKDSVKAKARQEAIENAKKKAEELADDLDVDLVQVVDFQESSVNPFPPHPIYMTAGMKGESDSSASVPTIAKGQNKFTSNVTITYKIK